MHVRRDAVPLSQQHDVVAHQFAPGNPARLPVTNNQRAWARQIAQGFERTLRAPLLDESDAHDHKDEAQQHEGFMAIAERHVDRSASHQQQEHRFRCDLTQ